MKTYVCFSLLSCIPSISCIPPILHPSSLHPSYSASLLSCIPPILHPSYPASLLSCIPPILHLFYLASLLSCISSILRPSYPASLLSCIPPILHLTCPASPLSCIPPILHSSCPYVRKTKILLKKSDSKARKFRKNKSFRNFSTQSDKKYKRKKTACVMQFSLTDAIDQFLAIYGGNFSPHP